MDDDIETDNDQLRMAHNHINRELNHGWKHFRTNKNYVRNISRLKDYQI